MKNLSGEVEEVYQASLTWVGNGVTDHTPLVELGIGDQIARTLVADRVKKGDTSIRLQISECGLTRSQKVTLFQARLLLEGQHDEYIMQHEAEQGAAHWGVPGKLPALDSEEAARRTTFVDTVFLSGRRMKILFRSVFPIEAIWTYDGLM